MAKNIFSGWKKFSSNGKNTIMQHPSGHKMVLKHKSLKPEHLEQLHALPSHTNETQSEVKLAEGGEIRQSNPKLEQSKKFPPKTKEQDLVDSVESPELSQSVMSEPRRQYAEGADPVQPTESQASAVVAQDTSTAPQASSDSGAANIAPDVVETRKIYNSLAMPSVDAKGGIPDADTSTDKQFGPNGEAPKQFDASLYKQAQSKFTEQQTKGQDEERQTALATVEENKAREAAGLAPLPVNAAALAAKQDPKLQAQVAQDDAPKSQQDPYGTQAYSDAYMKGVNEQKAGLSREAQAQGQMGQAQAQDLGQAQERQQKALQDYQTHFQNLDNERQALVKDIQNQHIDPNHYFSSMGTGSKIATAVSLIASGIGSGLTGQKNMALDFLHNQIERDVASQKANLGKSENLLSANMRQFGNIRDATDMTRVMQSDIISNQLKQEAAKAQGPLAKARLLEEAGKLDQQSAPILSQIAMRKTLLSGMQSGHIAPEQVIRAIVPEGQQPAYHKELKEAQDMSAARDNALSALDQLTKINTIGNRVAHPFDSTRQINAIKGAVIPALSKASAGRFTEEDAKYVDHLFDTLGSGPQAIATARRELDKLVSEKMHYPMLKSIGIDASQLGRYGRSGGNNRFQLGPVKQ